MDGRWWAGREAAQCQQPDTQPVKLAAKARLSRYLYLPKLLLHGGHGVDRGGGGGVVDSD